MQTMTDAMMVWDSLVQSGRQSWYSYGLRNPGGSMSKLDILARNCVTDTYLEKGLLSRWTGPESYH